MSTATTLKDRWFFNELPEGFYSASISGADDRWLFRAIPNRGDWCVERVSADRHALQKEVERWLAGEQVPGFYSASF